VRNNKQLKQREIHERFELSSEEMLYSVEENLPGVLDAIPFYSVYI
jgi:hypothetical protein